MSAAGKGWQAAVLSGGAAYAAYEVGILKALTQGECTFTGYQPIDFQVLSGTSAGSFNAAIMASQPGLPSATTADYLEQVWLERIASGAGACGNGAIRYRGDLSRFFTPACYTENPVQPFAELAADTAYFMRDLVGRAAEFTFSRRPLSRRLLSVANISSFLSTDPYAALLNEVVDLEGIRRSDKILIIAATNWGAGQLQLFGNADLTDAIGRQIILASSAFPGLPPVLIDGVPYADGGYVLNTPLKPAVYAGADVLHVVYLDPDVSRISLARMENTIDTVDRSVTIFRAAILNRDLDCAADINRGLYLLENPEAATALSDDQRKGLLRLIGRMQNHPRDQGPFRPVTIHRYHPRDDLGGVVGLLNFDRDQITHLIERGFVDAAEHDCTESGCLFPDGTGLDS
jgi:predicted acylesterase/phospholipase RssA